MYIITATTIKGTQDLKVGKKKFIDTYNFCKKTFTNWGESVGYIRFKNINSGISYWFDTIDLKNLGLID